MNKMKILTLVAVVSLGAAFTATSRADEWNKKTKITFSQPVEVPGTVLQPGTYTFQLYDSAADRHIVQIFDANRMHLLTSVMTIDTERPNEVTGKTALTFYETPTGQPPAIKDWYYPGEEFGQHFIYKNRKVQLTQASHQENNTQVAENTPPPAPAPAAVAPEPTPEPAAPEVAQNEPPAVVPPAREAAPAPAPPVLPQTASDIPFLTLIGLLSLGTAAGLRKLVKQVA